jgi:hypothetical protein
MSRKLLPLALVATIALAGCGSGAGSSSSAGTGATGSTPAPSTSAPTGARSTTQQASSLSPRTVVAAPGGTATRSTLPTKVLVVIEENHSLRQMRAGMPYLAGLSDTYGYATHWHALTHPSEPNYLAIVGGSTFGVTNDAAPSTNARKVGRAASVFSQARRAGRTAATYAESIPSRCSLSNHGSYAVRHNPWTYFAADRTACRAHDVGTGSFAAAARANRLPNVGLLVPNLVDDAHDGSLARADAWLRTRLAPVLASSDFTSGRLVVVVTADEDDKHSGNTVLTSVLTPRVHHKVVTTALTHYSLTRFIAQVLGLTPLRQARQAPDMVAAFGLRR